MEDYELMSSDELRAALDVERARFAEKQKALLEMKSKINRGKLGSASSATEKTLSVFLRSCCEETEKEQSYVSTVIERVSVTADRTRSSLEKVNQHAQEVFKNVESDVLELSDNLQRVTSSRKSLFSVLERRGAKGRVLRKRDEETFRSSTYQIDRAEKLYNQIEGRIDSQISLLESQVAHLTDLSSRSQMELLELEKESEVEVSTLTKHQEEEHAIQDQFEKTEAKYEHLETQLRNRNKARECAESDKDRIEMDVIELREIASNLSVLVSSKVKHIEENEEQTGQLSSSLTGLSDVLLAAESEINQFEKSLLDMQEAAKVASDEMVRSLEREVVDVGNQLSTETVRANVMDTMFGSNIELTRDEWMASIEKAKVKRGSSNGTADVRNSLLLELDSAKSELEKILQISKDHLDEYNVAQNTLRNAKKHNLEDLEEEDLNTRVADSRITNATQELENLTNAKCAETKDAFVTPNPPRHSSLQNLRKASVEASRGLSDDSDAESVKKSVVDLPDGIVRRNAATQQCSTVRASDASLKNVAGNGGTSTELTELTKESIDGDVTMEGIPLSASIDHASHDKKVENWIQDTPDNNSPASGTTAEMMDDRFPKNIFNETAALNDTDITMDMEDDDLNLSMLGMPPATATKTLYPPPVRHSNSKASIFMNDSDSDANASVWGEDF